MDQSTYIKQTINLREVVERELSYKPTTSSKKYDAYSCPLHRETKGTSFAVYDEAWTCFGKCDSTGDVFAFIQQYHGMTFIEAKRYLIERYLHGNVPGTDNRPRRRDRRRRQPRQQPPPTSAPAAPISSPPPAAWQQNARAVIEEAQHTLWSDVGERARRYLHGRGFNEWTIAYWNLGYVPGQPDTWLKMHNLNVPAGILIPWLAGGHVWGLKVRRAAGQPKYVQVKGGNVKGALYMADNLRPGQPAIIDEGEFNALAMWQSGAEFMRPVAIGSTGNKHIDRRWLGALTMSPVVFARMDAGSGDAALDALRKMSAGVRPAVLPDALDPNELLIRSQWLLWDWMAYLVEGLDSDQDAYIADVRSDFTEAERFDQYLSTQETA